MKSTYVTIFFVFFLYSINFSANELKYETSPYLLQHAKNPVNWMPWGEKAFKLAKKENKPIFLSIGYSTCHWCHVMEEESFTDEKIAKILNKYFISVKVDREEFPQIDALYQKIYRHYSGHVGGWPLSVFMTPKREPFYITTYIPPQKRSYAEGMDTLLSKLYKIYKDDTLLQKNIEAVAVGKKKKNTLSYEQISLKSLIDNMHEEYDEIYEGFGQGKKFPEVSKMMLMMDLAELGSDKPLRRDFFSMLDTMALRGLYDHVEGGFFRYCVDAAWEIPHFEKMLYNQAELISLYTRAYLLSGKELYKKIVFETIDMSEKRFKNNEGLFWSASDADSMQEEGAYYTFELKEIQKALKNNPHKKELLEALDMFKNGNFKGKEHLNFFTKKRPKGFYDFTKELQKIREKRVYPFIDKKINTAWNAMMIEALYKASVLDNKLAIKADKSLQQLIERMFVTRELYHQTTKDNPPKQKALLEDYAFLIGALIAAYEVDYDWRDLNFAEYLLIEAKKKFYKDTQWYLSNDGLSIVAGSNDKYYKSAQAKILEDSIKIALLKDSFRYERLFRESMQNLTQELGKKQTDVPALAELYLMQKYGVIVLKSSLGNLQQNKEKIKKIRYPYLLTKDTEYQEYLACTLRQCFAKEKDLHAIIKKINILHKNIGIQ